MATSEDINLAIDTPTVRRTVGADVQSIEGVDARSETVATEDRSERVTNWPIESHVQVRATIRNEVGGSETSA